MTISRERQVLGWLHEEYTGEIKTEAENEHFSLRSDSEQSDLDIHLFGSGYTQQSLSDVSSQLFRDLATAAGGGPDMIRELAEAPSTLSAASAKKLASPLGELLARLPGYVTRDEQAWVKISGAVQTAKALVTHFGVEVRDSYAKRWLNRFVAGHAAWHGNDAQLIKDVTDSLSGACWPHDPAAAILHLQDRIRDLCASSHPGKLRQIGPAMMNFFLRDCIDLPISAICWKHDSTNQEFWLIQSAILPDLSITQIDDPIPVLRLLGRYLTPDEIRSGWVRAINTTVYRLMKPLPRHTFQPK